MLASFHYHFSDDFQCRSKESELLKRPDCDEAIKRLRKEKGCGVIVKKPKVVFQNERIQYHSCLCHPNYALHNFSSLYSTYLYFKKGILPDTGSLMDQPSKLMDVLSIIEDLSIQKEKESSEKQMKEMEKRSKSSKSNKKPSRR